MKFKKIATITGVVFSCGVSGLFVYCKGGTSAIPDYTAQNTEATIFVNSINRLANSTTQYEAGLLDILNLSNGQLALNNIYIAGFRDILLDSYNTYANFYTSQAAIGFFTLYPLGLSNSIIQSCSDLFLTQEIYTLPDNITSAALSCPVPLNGTYYVDFNLNYSNVPFNFYLDSSYTNPVCSVSIPISRPSPCLIVGNALSSQRAVLSNYKIP